MAGTRIPKAIAWISFLFFASIVAGVLVDLLYKLASRTLEAADLAAVGFGGVAFLVCRNIYGLRLKSNRS